jgi:hypothetical protein
MAAVSQAMPDNPPEPMFKPGVDIPRHLMRKLAVSAIGSVVGQEATLHPLGPKLAEKDAIASVLEGPLGQSEQHHAQ